MMLGILNWSIGVMTFNRFKNGKLNNPSMASLQHSAISFLRIPFIMSARGIHFKPSSGLEVSLQFCYPSFLVGKWDGTVSTWLRKFISMWSSQLIWSMSTAFWEVLRAQTTIYTGQKTWSLTTTWQRSDLQWRDVGLQMVCMLEPHEDT